MHLSWISLVLLNHSLITIHLQIDYFDVFQKAPENVCERSNHFENEATKIAFFMTKNSCFHRTRSKQATQIRHQIVFAKVV